MHRQQHAGSAASIETAAKEHNDEADEPHSSAASTTASAARRRTSAGHFGSLSLFVPLALSANTFGLMITYHYA